jgi:hypothetical protein
LRLTHQTQPRKTAQTIPKAENENMKCVVVFQKPILRSMKFPNTTGIITELLDKRPSLFYLSPPNNIPHHD